MCWIRCENDITAGTYRVECQMIFLSQTSTDISKFVQSIGSLNISSRAILLDGKAQSISGCALINKYWACIIRKVAFTSGDGFCSCALNINNKGGTYSWPETVVGQTVSQMCQYGELGQNVTRYCNRQVWMEDASVCPTVVTKEVNQLSLTIQNVRWCGV